MGGPAFLYQYPHVFRELVLHLYKLALDLLGIWLLGLLALDVRLYFSGEAKLLRGLK